MRTTSATTELIRGPADGLTHKDGTVVHEPDGAGAMSTSADDGAVRALVDLRIALDDTIAGLVTAVEQADLMIGKRRSGTPSSAITVSLRSPMIAEILAYALQDLGEVGSRFRHEMAVALRREGLSMRSIGEVLGSAASACRRCYSSGRSNVGRLNCRLSSVPFTA
jgi:hypothetical protein